MNLWREECHEQSNDRERDRSEAKPAAADVAAKRCNTKSHSDGRTNELNKRRDIEQRHLRRRKTIRQSECVTARGERKNGQCAACYSEATGDVWAHGVKRPNDKLCEEGGK